MERTYTLTLTESQAGVAGMALRVLLRATKAEPSASPEWAEIKRDRIERIEAALAALDNAKEDVT